MRNSILTPLRTLLTAARWSLYTRRTKAAMPKLTLDPEGMPARAVPTDGFDDWMFDAEQARETSALSREMNRLHASLGDLREALSMISGEMPFPVEALTQTPCAILHHDRDLFDGEVEGLAHAQDTVIGGAGDFLFGDVSDFDEMPTRHLNAA